MARRRRRRSSSSTSTLLLIAAAVGFYFWSKSASASAGTPLRYWFNPTTLEIRDQLGLTPPGEGFRPASEYELATYLNPGGTL